ncbi:hypothetical protein NUW58_g3583 [Xylaria curta]|uniref:Uncharacterized protein n=1 Tax=Xylaria curta TaxID=42375 RepID=A0ACC1PBJ8_9PEZI|nr:hypothetical protein NUW58_g3583 [Xylaria curta]
MSSDLVPTALSNGDLLGACVAPVAVAGAFVLIRLFNSWKVTGNFHLDDWMAVLALIVLVALAVLSYLGSTNQVPNDPSTPLATTPQVFTALLWVNPAGLYFGKVPLLIMVLRIFETSKWVRINSYIVLIVPVILFTGGAIYATTYCSTVGKIVTIDYVAGCLRTGLALGVWNGAVAIASDVIILAIPVPVVFKLNIPNNKKIGLLLLFLTGILNILSATLQNTPWQMVNETSQESQDLFSNSLPLRSVPDLPNSSTTPMELHRTIVNKLMEFNTEVSHDLHDIPEKNRTNGGDKGMLLIKALEHSDTVLELLGGFMLPEQSCGPEEPPGHRSPYSLSSESTRWPAPGEATSGWGDKVDTEIALLLLSSNMNVRNLFKLLCAELTARPGSHLEVQHRVLVPLRLKGLRTLDGEMRARVLVNVCLFKHHDMEPTSESTQRSCRPRKHFIPLESNPNVFTKLIHKLGVSRLLCFQDVYAIDDPDLLAFIPRPAYALVLICPETYGKVFSEEDATAGRYDAFGDNEAVTYFEQTIHNACGLYAILHSVCNGEARKFIEPETTLAHLLQKCIQLKPAERAQELEDSKPLESAYSSVAKEGDTEAPNAEDEVAFHYFCFVKSHQNGHLFLLDGDRKRPIDLGDLGAEADVLSEKCLNVIRGIMADAAGQDDNLNFNLMALVHV